MSSKEKSFTSVENPEECGNRQHAGQRGYYAICRGELDWTHGEDAT